MNERDLIESVSDELVLEELANYMEDFGDPIDCVRYRDRRIEIRNLDWRRFHSYPSYAELCVTVIREADRRGLARIH